MAVKKTQKATGTGKSKATAGKTSPRKPAVKKSAPKKAAVTEAAAKKTVKRVAPKKAAAQKPSVSAAAVKKVTPAPTVRPLDRAEFHRRVRVTAYYKFVKRGYRHGKHISDWYEAEKEITSKL